MLNAGNNRYLKNISANSLSIIVNVLAGMLFVRILIDSLGVDGYALVSMTSALTLAIGILTASMNSAIGRFLTISLSKNDDLEANAVFNSAFWGDIALFMILLPLVGVVAWYSPTIFQVAEHVQQVRGFVFLALTANLVSSVMAVFGTSCFVRNRFDLSSGLQTIILILRISVIVALFHVWRASIISVGVGMLVAASCGFGGALILWRRLTPMLYIDWRLVSLDNIKDMLSMGFWVSIDAIGMLMISNINTVLVGSFQGITLAGIYGLYHTVASYIAILGAALAGPIQPEIYAAYARSDQNTLNQVLYSSIRFSLSVMALLSALLIGFRLHFIAMWLGRGHELVTVPLVAGVPLVAFSNSLAPFAAVLNAKKKTGRIAFATVATGIGHLVSCLVLYYIGEFSIFFVALSSGIWQTVKMALLIWFAGEKLSHSIRTFVRTTLYFGTTLIPILIVAIVLGNLIPATALHKVTLAIVLLIVFWFLCVFWGLKPYDFERVLGRLWHSSTLGRVHHSLHVWKMKHFYEPVFEIQEPLKINYGKPDFEQVVYHRDCER